MGKTTESTAYSYYLILKSIINYGNFRLQNPTTDPQVIDYCLDNLRVALGRVEMPWYAWQPDENKNPIDEANAGKLDPKVDAAMKMTQRLAAEGIFGYPLKKEK